MLGKVLLVAFYGTSIKDQDEKLRRCTNFFIKAMQHITHVASWHWESLQKNLQKHFNKSQKQNKNTSNTNQEGVQTVQIKWCNVDTTCYQLALANATSKISITRSPLFKHGALEYLCHYVVRFRSHIQLWVWLYRCMGGISAAGNIHLCIGNQWISIGT